MKKTCFTFIVALVYYGTYAQQIGSSPVYYNGNNVGIGTSSPAALLDLGNTVGIKQFVYGSGGDSGYLMGLGVNLGQAPNTFTAFIGPPGGDGQNGDASFSVASATTSWPYSAYTTRLSVLSSGNVGIGTANPVRPFSVVTGALGDAVNITNNGSGNAVIQCYTTNGGQSYIGQINGGWSGLANPSIFQSNQSISITPVLNSAAMGINLLTNGNVGVGTTTPDARLAVAGTIHTQEVKVDMTGWSDYVFKPTYKLPKLSEVKTYVDKNHHLPDMPSEKEVVDNGINLTEILKLQQKKIEELTLYLIKEKGRNDKQEKINRQMSKLISQRQKKH